MPRRQRKSREKQSAAPEVKKAAAASNSGSALDQNSSVASKAATLPHSLVAICLSYLDGTGIVRCARVNQHWSKLPASKLASTWKSLVQREWPNCADPFFLPASADEDVWRARFKRHAVVDCNWATGRSQMRTFRCGAARASCVAVDSPCVAVGMDSGHVLVLDDVTATKPTLLRAADREREAKAATYYDYDWRITVRYGVRCLITSAHCGNRASRILPFAVGSYILAMCCVWRWIAQQMCW